MIVQETALSPPREEFVDPIREAIVRVRRGDVDAFEAVVDQYQDSLRAYTLVHAPDPQHADDLAQTAFVRAYERIADFDPSRDFGAWLFGIARNLVRQAWQTASRDRRHDEPLRAFLQERLAERAVTSESDDVLAALRSCIENLPERWRGIVERHYRERQGIADIARQDGNQPATVGVTLFRIRARLRECVEERVRER